MIHAFGPDLDEAFLRNRLRQESSEDAYGLLSSYARRPESFSASDLERELDRMLGREPASGEETGADE